MRRCRAHPPGATSAGGSWIANVLITAHQAFLTREALGEIARVTVANIDAFAHGRPFLADTTLTQA